MKNIWVPYLLDSKIRVAIFWEPQGSFSTEDPPLLVRLRQCSLQGDSNSAVCSVDTIHDCDAQRAMHFNSHKMILVAKVKFLLK